MERGYSAGRANADLMLGHYHSAAGTRLEPSQFASLVVGQDVLVPVCAPDRNGAPKWTLPARTEAEVPRLAYGPKSGLGRILSALETKDRGKFSGRFSAQLAVALLSMAQQGQGVAWIPQTLAAEHINAGRLVDAGFGRFSIEVEIRLFRALHGNTKTAESFWRAVGDTKQVR
jgi:DNA-binding transcriptional LysR family regulator